MDAEIKTEGQRLLSEVSGTESELAAKIGCSPASVGHWRIGRRAPGQGVRHKLDLLFGIPQLAWDVAPGGKIPSNDAEPEAGPVSDKSDDTLEITKTQIRNILDNLEDESLVESDSMKLRGTLSKLLALRARLERDQDLLEDRIVREHPEWMRTKVKLLAALKPYPEAAKAAAEALR